MSDTATPDSVAALAGTKHDLGCRCWPHYSPQAVTDAFAAGRKEGARIESDRHDEDDLHTSRIIACLVRRLGGHVIINPTELANEPAAVATVGTSGGFEIKVIEPDPPGPSLVDMGALSLGYVERSPTMLGGSLNPSPDCGGPRKPPGATDVWWCDPHAQFHGSADSGTTGGDGEHA